MDDHLVRGNFGAFIGVCGEELLPNTIYNIYSNEYPGESLHKIKQYIKKLAYNNTEFYAVCDRIYFGTDKDEVKIFAGGDCFYCTVGSKLQYNFLDHSAPLNTTIINTEIPKDKLANIPFSKISADN
jgi:hypothetical protein